jgi:hypothetical protein
MNGNSCADSDLSNFQSGSVAYQHLMYYSGVIAMNDNNCAARQVVSNRKFRGVSRSCIQFMRAWS